MAKRKRYHVTKRSDDDWQVIGENAGRASAVCNTKAEAVERGRGLAANAEGQLLIHRADGTFQEERTYPRSTDPCPPKG